MNRGNADGKRKSGGGLWKGAAPSPKGPVNHVKPMRKGRDEEWEVKKSSAEVEEQRRRGGGGRMKRMETSAGRGALLKIEEAICAAAEKPLCSRWRCQSPKASVADRDWPQKKKKTQNVDVHGAQSTICSQRGVKLEILMKTGKAQSRYRQGRRRVDVAL